MHPHLSFVQRGKCLLRAAGLKLVLVLVLGLVTACSSSGPSFSQETDATPSKSTTESNEKSSGKDAGDGDDDNGDDKEDDPGDEEQGTGEDSGKDSGEEDEQCMGESSDEGSVSTTASGTESDEGEVDSDVTSTGESDGESSDEDGSTSTSESETSESSGDDPLTMEDIQPIFESNCSCHNQQVNTPGNLLLREGEAYKALVGVKSSSTLNQVEAGLPNESYLVHKLAGTHSGISGGKGKQMPIDGSGIPEPLDDKIQSLIVEWIEQGAIEK